MSATKGYRVPFPADRTSCRRRLLGEGRRAASAGRARAALLGLGAVPLALAIGCADPGRAAQPEDSPTPPEIVRGTVGAFLRFSSVRTMGVVGYGLVMNLQNTGSRGMPANLRRRLLREMSKAGIADAAKILESPTTAPVLVRGTVMPFHTRGSRFDVEVLALPGTETKSLEGGTLMRAVLAPVVHDVDGRQVMGASVAVGHGPLFIDPPSGSGSEGLAPDPRRARVIGGGRFGGDRKIRAELLEQNLRMCLLLEQAINARFPRCAVAKSSRILSHEAFEPLPEGDETEPHLPVEPPARETQYYLQLTVPPAYTERWMHFTQVVASLYLDSRPAAVEERIRFLLAKLRDADLRLSACYGLEALGVASIEPLTALLNDPDRDVRLSAATVLIALGDSRGTDVLMTVARGGEGAQRLAAIGALSRSDQPEAMRTLRDLTASPDLAARLAAYESLRGMPGQAVVETVDAVALGDQRFEIRQFAIDLVHTDGPPLVVANAANDPRLILFGDSIQLKPPIFFDEGRYWVKADVGEEKLTIRPPAPEPPRPFLRKEILIPFDVLYYVVLMDQLGASYPHVLKRLAEADQLGRIAGKFVLRQPAPTPALEREWN